MEPVVVVDVAKGSSVVQAFRKRSELWQAVDIMHEKSRFEQFSGMLDMLQIETGFALVLVLEATEHYHRALVSYLDRSGYTYYIVNPLQSK